ncbi:3'-5' exonuclease [Burkholderia sp. BCC1047]|uniref:3'-5' exonuclease n=1 Tax=Burkholderia sp. BCC1047 TaxID=2676299 RepID=UPI001FC8ADF1|nr:3'-5' exonuclease [Burkholderia sp. BCC1047]
MVLFRRRDDGEAMKQLLADLIKVDKRLPEKKQRLKLLTYHRSKGLEAVAVFLIGDCVHMTDSPYKNQAYIAAGLGADNDITPFDTAQRHEILRLAYVAITRAARQCFWFIGAPTGAQGRPRASAYSPRQAAFPRRAQAIAGRGWGGRLFFSVIGIALLELAGACSHARSECVRE